MATGSKNTGNSRKTSASGSTRSSSASAGRSGSSSGNARSSAGRSGSSSGSGRSGAGSTRSSSSFARGRNSSGSASRSTGSAAEREQMKLKLEQDDNLRDEITVILVLLLSVLLVLSYMKICGSFGNIANTVVFGLFGRFGYVFPFVLFFITLFAVANRKNRSVAAKTVFCVCMMFFIAGLVQLFAGGYDPVNTFTDYFTKSKLDYEGSDATYGGFFGGVLCKLLVPLMGNVGAACIMIAAVLIFFLLIAGKAIFTSIAKNSIEGAQERRQLKKELEEEFPDYEEERRRAAMERRRQRERERQQKSSVSETERFDEEEFLKSLETPVPEEEKKTGIIEKLMRRGMGLDAPEILDTSDVVYSAPETYSNVTAQEVSSDVHEFEIDGSEPADLRENDFVADELDRKFGGREKATVVNLGEQRGSSRASVTRTYMVDEEPDEYETGLSSVLSGADPEENTGHNDYSLNEGFAGYGSMQTESGAADGHREGIGETEAAEGLFAAESGNAEETAYNSGSEINQTHSSADDAGDGMKDEHSKADDADDGQKKSSLEGRTVSGATGFNSPEEIKAVMEAAEKAKKEKPYVFPPISLLNKGSGARNVNKGELQATVDKLQKTFESFGVGVTVTDATCGPTVTRYELLPDQGVKVKTITGLADDIKLALAAAEIRIEAPIPGKAAVGIEVPNSVTSPVLLRDLIDSPEFKDAQSNLTFAVGKDIGGKTICFDIGSMPHMLIAGATGSGKSVCINSLILSIIYKAKPSDVKMIMIDPKRVELIGYNGIPHLLVPVVTDVKKASGALNWAIAEMDDRYERFAQAGVNNLASYNRRMEEKYYEEGNEGECPDRLPQILIIVDELNDLMMTANSKEVEASICRLTQLARASGIHVVLATQRPSVNVITGTIKANIPSRIAFSVSSIVDSRTIIDQAGAEKLLGKGDMLFFPQGYPKPVRLQGAYVSDKEISGVVEFIKNKCSAVVYRDDVSQHIEKNAATESGKGSAAMQGGQGADAGDDSDELFEQAGRYIIEKQKASIGNLQRQFRIGFNRAARIMDSLSEAGVVGPEDGTKPRAILMSVSDFEEYLTKR